MISHITLTVNSTAFEVLSFRYGFHRLTDAKGRPGTGLRGGDFYNILLESTEDTRLLEAFIHQKKPFAGSITAYNADGVAVRSMVWDEAYLSSIEEWMSRTSGEPMLYQVAINPQRLDINRAIRLDRRFPQTYAFWWEEYKPEEQPVAGGSESVVEPVVKEVRWIDKNTKKDIDQALPDTWASLSVQLENFNAKDQLRFVIKEKNGHAIHRGSAERELTEKAGGNGTLEIGRAFKFAKDANANKEVEVTVYWGEQSLAGKTTLKENSGGIWGLSAADAVKVRNDIHAVFAAERFSDFRALVLADSADSKHIAFIKKSDIGAVLRDTRLDSDDRLAVEMVSNTINSTKTHLVKYMKGADIIPDDFKAIMPPRENIVNDFISRGWLVNATTYLGPSTRPTASGSVSVIVEDYGFPNDYFRYSTEEDGQQKKVAVPNPAGLPVITLHEIIGHGRSLSLGRGDASQHEDAILFENLLLRVMGYGDIQRDGGDHTNSQVISNPRKQPQFK